MQHTTLIPTLPASNMTRAKAFYAEKLDLKPVEEMADGSARYEAGDGWFLVYESQFAGTNKATAAGWSVDDIGAAVTELKQRGVQFEEYDIPGVTTENSIARMPDGRGAAWFKDSEGNIIGLFEMA